MLDLFKPFCLVRMMYFQLGIFSVVKFHCTYTDSVCNLISQEGLTFFAPNCGCGLL